MRVNFVTRTQIFFCFPKLICAPMATTFTGELKVLLTSNAMLQYKIIRRFERNMKKISDLVKSKHQHVGLTFQFISFGLQTGLCPRDVRRSQRRYLLCSQNVRNCSSRRRQSALNHQAIRAKRYSNLVLGQRLSMDSGCRQWGTS